MLQSEREGMDVSARSRSRQLFGVSDTNQVGGSHALFAIVLHSKGDRADMLIFCW